MISYNILRAELHMSIWLQKERWDVHACPTAAVYWAMTVKVHICGRKNLGYWIYTNCEKRHSPPCIGRYRVGGLMVFRDDSCPFRLENQ